MLRYFEHEFPIRPGTQDLPLEQLVDRQWYRLAWWRVADDELNYRRFFDVDTLAALRVEDPAVFAATHALLLELVAAGALQGLRIDHPDGLADPRGYLRRLDEATGGLWVVVEKILEGDEHLPRDWPCAGTTGYDSLQRVGGLFADPAAAAPLGDLLTELTGEPTEFAAVVEHAKREVVEQSLYAEVNRLIDLLVAICHESIALRDHTRRELAAQRGGAAGGVRPVPRVRRSGRSRRRPRAWRSSTGPSRRPGRGCPRTPGTPSTWSATSCSGAPPAAGRRARRTRPGAPSSSSGSSRPAGR